MSLITGATGVWKKVLTNAMFREESYGSRISNRLLRTDFQNLLEEMEEFPRIAVTHTRNI